MKVLGAWAVLALSVILVVAYLGQRSLIYVPDTWDPGSYAELASDGRDVSLTTEDGLTLSAWLVEPGQDAEDLDVAVLYLPGNGGNRLIRAEVGQELAARGFTVLLLDYRGYGGNPGSPSEEGLTMDAEAASAWLRDNGYPAERTIYVGESIGTGVATTLAVSDPPAALLLRSPYTSLADVARDHLRVPVGLLLKDQFETLRKMPSVRVPTTILAGEADDLIAAQQSTEVAEAAPHLHELVVVPGAGHNDDVWFGPLIAEHVEDLAEQTITKD